MGRDALTTYEHKLYETLKMCVMMDMPINEQDGKDFNRLHKKVLDNTVKP